jgi:Ca2+-binding RTX toxin-like protein
VPHRRIRWSLGRTAAGLPLVLAATAGVLAAPGVANAAPQPAQVHVELVGGVPLLWFEAGAGTVNDVEIHTTAQGYELEDLNGTVVLDTTDARGCVQAGSRIIACPSIPNLRARVDLADGDDVFGSYGSSLPVRVYGDDGNDLIHTGWGEDYVEGGAGADTIYGESGDDHLEGGGGDDLLSGMVGNDLLRGAWGADKLYGLDGDDQLYGNDAEDTLQGGAGDDYLDGGYRKDVILGNGGNDTLIGDVDFSDDLYGNAGNDRFVMSVLGDYRGGEGTDTADYGAWPHRVWVSLDDNRNDGSVNPDDPCDSDLPWPLDGCVGPTMANVHSDVENVIGSSKDDTIIGDASANALDGGAGNDVLKGLGGDDYLDAQAGTGQKDYGGDGEDTCVGYGLAIADHCEH